MATATVPEATASNGNNTEQEVFRQSVTVPLPKTLDGVKKIFSDADGNLNEQALVYIVQAGIKQVGNNRLRQKLTGVITKEENGVKTYTPEFHPLEGSYDVTELLLAEAARKRLSQREKVVKDLQSAGLAESVIEIMMKNYDSSVGVAATEDVTYSQQELRIVTTDNGKKLVMKAGAEEDEDQLRRGTQYVVRTYRK